MRILFDHNVPRFLRHRVPSAHAVSTAARERWDELANGRLLANAVACFKLLVTRDRDFADVRLLVGKRIAVAFLTGPSQTRTMLEGLIDDLVARLDTIAPGTLIVSA